MKPKRGLRFSGKGMCKHWVLVLLIALVVMARCDSVYDEGEVPDKINGFVHLPRPSVEEMLERWKYKPPTACKAIPDHLELDLKSLIAADYVLNERKLACTATTCVPVEFADKAPGCSRISVPDWRVRTGEFIYGAELQDGVCVCRIAKYKTLLSSVDEVKALREEMNVMKDALASIAYLMDRNLGQRNIDKYTGHFISQRQPDCTAKRLYEELDAEREAERLESEARRRRENLAYWEALCAHEEPPANIEPAVFWFHCKGKVLHNGKWIAVEELETWTPGEKHTEESNENNEGVEGPIQEL